MHIYIVDDGRVVILPHVISLGELIYHRATLTPGRYWHQEMLGL